MIILLDKRHTPCLQDRMEQVAGQGQTTHTLPTRPHGAGRRSGTNDTHPAYKTAWSRSPVRDKQHTPCLQDCMEQVAGQGQTTHALPTRPHGAGRRSGTNNTRPAYKTAWSRSPVRDTKYQHHIEAVECDHYLTLVSNVQFTVPRQN